MEYWLPLFFVGVMGLALLLYVVLDGYDLGIGLMLPFATEAEKDVMIAAIGPFWDANETWIVLGVGVLLVAFPGAHGLVLTHLYLPVAFMLLGLILRGIAFDFRVKAGDQQRRLWNTAFSGGSLLAAVSQGWMLGSYVSGLENTWLNSLFSLLIALTLPALYVMLGSAWLLIKTEGALFAKAVRWARAALLPMGAGLLLTSIATPLVSETIAAKWFSLPETIGLAPIPLFTIVLYLTIATLLRPKHFPKPGSEWWIFTALILICVLAAIGLAYSIFPEIVIDRLGIWEAAASPASLRFSFIGTAITLPAILGYTIFVYSIFRGKATKLSYE